MSLTATSQHTKGDVVEFDLKLAARESKASTNAHLRAQVERGFSGDPYKSSGATFLRDAWQWPDLKGADYTAGTIRGVVSKAWPASSAEDEDEYTVFFPGYGEVGSILESWLTPTGDRF